MNDIIFKTLLLKGEAGNNIGTIEKTATSGLTDTYTITLTDGTTTSFNVTNGRSIVSIEGVSTEGSTNIYEITYNDGTTQRIEVEKLNYHVDTELSTLSTNPVENRVVAGKFGDIAESIEEEQTERESADESLRRAIDAIVSPSGSSIVVDSSLTISGAGADAKVVGEKFAKVQNELDDYRGELKTIITNKDNGYYIASDLNEFGHNEGEIVSDTQYYSKKIKMLKGEFFRASLGASSNMYPICKLNSDGTFKSVIVKRQCLNYIWVADEDCYVNFTSNIAQEVQDVWKGTIQTGYAKDAYNMDCGIKSGYMNYQGYNFDTHYMVTNPITLGVGDILTVNAKAGNNVYAIVLFNENGEVVRHIAGVDAENTHEYSLKATRNGYAYVSSYEPYSDSEYTVTVNKVTHSLTDSNFNESFNKTSLNDFTEPYMGIVSNQNITDLPNGLGGTLEVIRSNADYVEQRLYQYSTNNLLVRMISTDGTPYSDWKALEKSHIYGKKIIGIGDSLMHGNNIGTSYTWLNLLSEYGMKPYNYGINGNTVAVQTVETTNPPMVNRISTIHDTVPDCDYFVLIGGANDNRLSVPLGDTDSTDTSTFCGALNSIIDQVRELYPKCHIVFMTNYDRNPATNNLGLKDIDYVNAMLNVCAEKHVFCYDNYHDSGVDFFDDNFTAWADEGVYQGGTANHHFSPEGYKWLLPKYLNLVKSN
jgi:hypothetical protein